MASTQLNKSRDNLAKDLDEKEITLKNVRGRKDKDANKLFTFKVVANAGDPGLTEDMHFDVLSRYLICEKQSGNRVPTNNQYGNMYFLVKRPEHLWIHCEGSPDNEENNFQTTRRKDYTGNISVGKAGYFSIKTIPNINRPYSIGEVITAKELPLPEKPETSDFFVSAFPSDWGAGDFTKIYQSGKDRIIGLPSEYSKYSNDYWNHYGPPKTVKIEQGKVMASDNAHGGRVIAANEANEGYRQLKSLFPAHLSSVPGRRANTYRSSITATDKLMGNVHREYDKVLGTYQYKMILHWYLVHYALGIMNPDNATTVDSLKAGIQKYQGNFGYPDILAEKGGFLGQNITFNQVVYEDVNIDDKQRTAIDDCMPLVIASPNQFPTPKSRATGSILYEPTYSKIVDANPI